MEQSLLKISRKKNLKILTSFWVQKLNYDKNKFSDFSCRRPLKKDLIYERFIK